MQGIYAIVNVLNGKRYVGSSIDCARRYRTHVSALMSGRHVNPKLLSAWRKYGPAAFEMVVLEVVPHRSDLLVREQAWLATGHYNLAPRADRPPGMTRKFTVAERQRLSAARRGKPNLRLRGRKQSPEHVERAHAPLRGQKRPHVGQNISASKRGRKVPLLSVALIGNRRGAVPCSPEKKAKISAALKRPEVLARLSAHSRAMVRTPEHSAKIAEAQRERWRVRKMLGLGRSGAAVGLSVLPQRPLVTA